MDLGEPLQTLTLTKLMVTRIGLTYKGHLRLMQDEVASIREATIKQQKEDNIMLILTRNIGEDIIIGDNDVVITVLDIKGRQVRLGFEADKSVSIHRSEIFTKIKEEESSTDLDTATGNV